MVFFSRIPFEIISLWKFFPISSLTFFPTIFHKIPSKKFPFQDTGLLPTTPTSISMAAHNYVWYNISPSTQFSNSQFAPQTNSSLNQGTATAAAGWWRKSFAREIKWNSKVFPPPVGRVGASSANSWQHLIMLRWRLLCWKFAAFCCCCCKWQ